MKKANKFFKRPATFGTVVMTYTVVLLVVFGFLHLDRKALIESFSVIHAKQDVTSGFVRENSDLIEELEGKLHAVSSVNVRQIFQIHSLKIELKRLKHNLKASIQRSEKMREELDNLKKAP